jgi:hypothetical protein
MEELPVHRNPTTSLRGGQVKHLLSMNDPSDSDGLVRSCTGLPK